MSSYETGWLAFEQGKLLNDCPFYRTSAAAISWRNGWFDHKASLGI